MPIALINSQILQDAEHPPYFTEVIRRRGVVWWHVKLKGENHSQRDTLPFKNLSKATVASFIDLKV